MEGVRLKSERVDRLFTPRMERRTSRDPASCSRRLPSVSSTEPKRDPGAALAWCETPKLIRRDAALRRRLLVSRSSSGGLPTPEPCGGREPERFPSPESPAAPLSYSTVRADDCMFSCRTRRLLFSQALTSTLESGRSGVHASPEPLQSRADPDLDDSIIAGPPSSPRALTPLTPPRAGKMTLTPASEDSGFSSLGLDKSHDSSVEHDGSFQELLPGSSGRDKRRSRLERTRRLSTLREGGSQSDDAPRPLAPGSRDEVFAEGTPLSTATLRMQDLSLTPALQAVHDMSRTLHPQGSLEELLRPPAHAARLAGLIGRKMGLDRVDVIWELRARNLRHVLAAILSLLSDADLYRFGQVCDDWNDVISEDRRAASRRKSHIRELKVALEGGRWAQVADADTRTALACRSALGSVQAQARTPHTPTQSHSGSKRTQFLQVAKTLFSDEFLKPCPRCDHPARCHSLRAEGVCSWSDCCFRFCTACLCALHGSRDCALPSAKRRSRRDVLPGSAQSKRNVRRL